MEGRGLNIQNPHKAMSLLDIHYTAAEQYPLLDGFLLRQDKNITNHKIG